LDWISVVYILFSLPILYEDIKYQNIPDRYSLSAILILLFLIWYLDYPLKPALIAAAFILVVFLIPLLFGMDFGGGDLRYGVMSALVVGFPDIAYWLIVSSVIHVLILAIARKSVFGFAPAMFSATILLPFLPLGF